MAPTNAAAINNSTPPKVCDLCGDPAESLCSGCRKVRYCGTECQQGAWTTHIFQCNPRRPINTADHLALACLQDLIPTDPQTCEDWGFYRAARGEPEDRFKLFGLYIGILHYMNVKPLSLHRWRVRGVLVEEIKRLYEALPENGRGGYYPWFLQNQHVLDPSVAIKKGPLPQFENEKKQVWIRAGGKVTDSHETIEASVHKFEEGRRLCFFFWTFLLAGLHPDPAIPDMYIKLGFCVGNEHEEMELAQIYRDLIFQSQCPFEEFVAAYGKPGMYELFLKHGVTRIQQFNPPHLENLFHHLPTTWSVYHLKSAILTSESPSKVPLPVRCDYGYMNCKTTGEHKELDRIYGQLLSGSFGELRSAEAAAKLHHASISGKLFEHASSIIGMNDQEKRMFSRLMKNPYPLPDPGM